MREIRGCSLYTSELLTFPSLVYKMARIGKTDSTNGSNRAYVAISDQYGRKTGKIINIWGEKKNPIF